MELKYRKRGISRLKNHGFNRTFMELKFRSFADSPLRGAVLIVPLWN